MNDSLVRNALYGLTAIVLVALGGIVFLTATEHPAPDVLEQAVTAGVVAIAAILPGAMNRRVEIDQPAGDPVPVAEVAPARRARKAQGERGAVDALTAAVVVFVIVVIVLLLRNNGAF